MSALGKSVIDAISFLSSFHREVSKLLECVEGSMTGQGFLAPWGSGCHWGSRHYLQPEGWMPRYLFRLYAKPSTTNTKVDLARSAFFAVYLTPERCQEPTALWGPIVAVDPANLEPALDRVLLLNEGPPFLSRTSVTEWEPVRDLPEQLESFAYRASALVDLTNPSVIDQLVVSPLVDRLRQS